MQAISIIGLGLGKNVFRICGVALAARGSLPCLATRKACAASCRA